MKKFIAFILILSSLMLSTGLIACKKGVNSSNSNSSSVVDEPLPPERITEQQVNTFDENYVNLYGRAYVQNGELKLDHVTSGVEVGFCGSEFKAEINVSTNLYVGVYIDDSTIGERVELTAENKEYALAIGLEEGYHKVRIVKSSEIYDGQISVKRFIADEFYQLQENTGLKIEFIGDSITAGYGVWGTAGDTRSVENSDGCSSYAYYAAQELKANYSTMAISGICVKKIMWGEVSMADHVYPYISPLTGVDYNFDFNPDVVVINLGTNDASYINEKDISYAKQFSTDYYEFLQYVRQKNPNAYIICLYGMMGKNGNINDGIANAVQQMQDEKVIFRNNYPADNAGVAGHPTAKMQKTWGKSLALYIKELNVR